MSWEEYLASGGGGGIVGAILAYLGFDRRIKKIEEDVKLLLPRIEHDTHKYSCSQQFTNIQKTLESIDDKQDKMIYQIGELIGKESREKR